MSSTILVTGATSGLGLELVRKLVERRRETKILLGCRNVELARSQVDELAVKFPEAGVSDRVSVGPPLDLGDFASVAAFAKAINDDDTLQLHVLVNNAGMNKNSSGKKTRWPEIITVNYLGPFLLTLLLEDKLKRCMNSAEALPSRVINVSSIMHRFSTLAEGVRDPENKTVIEMFMRDDNGRKGGVDGEEPSTVLYGDTKLGNALFTEWLNLRWKNEENLRALSIDPGGVVTGIWRNTRWEGSKLMDMIFAPASDGAEALYDCCVHPISEQPQTVSFYARGAFKSSFLQNTPRSKRLALAAGIVAVVDWPLRKLSRGRIASGTNLVVANEACYDADVVKRLGDLTEGFVMEELSN